MNGIFSDRVKWMKIINEELSFFDLFLKYGQGRQSILIRKYCAGVGERIRTAGSRLEAERLLAKYCLNFEEECSSEILRKELRNYLERLLRLYWENKI